MPGKRNRQQFINDSLKVQEKYAELRKLLSKAKKEADSLLEKTKNTNKIADYEKTNEPYLKIYDRYKDTLWMQYEDFYKGPNKYDKDTVLEWINRNIVTIALLSDTNFRENITSKNPEFSQLSFLTSRMCAFCEMSKFWLNAYSTEDKIKKAVEYDGTEIDFELPEHHRLDNYDLADNLDNARSSFKRATGKGPNQAEYLAGKKSFGVDYSADQRNFADFTEKLSNALTSHDSSLYKDIINTVRTFSLSYEIGALPDKNETADLKKLNQKQQQALKMFLIKDKIDKYVNHKAKDGIKQNAFAKLEVVEELDKFVCDRIRELNPQTISLGKRQFDSKGIRPQATDVVTAYNEYKSGMQAPTSIMFNNTIEYINIVNRMLDPNANRDLIQTLNEYQQIINKLSVADKDGNLPKMTPKSIQELYQTITSGIVATSEYLKSAKKTTGLAHNIEELNKSLKGDLYSIRNTADVYDVDVSKLLSTREENVINISDYHGSPVGNGLSNRMAIELPNGKKGFFTEAKTCDPEMLFRQAFASLKNSFPGYDSEFDAILDGYVKAIANAPDLVTMKKPVDFTNTEIVANLPELDETVKKLNSSERLPEMLIAMQLSINKAKMNYTKYVDMKGIDKSTRIDTRNVAMSVVADLLGCGDLLARSVPLTVHSVNGNIEGTFMELAEGEDVNALDTSSPLFVATKESFKGQGLKSSVDIAIVDTVCGNIDRHIGNCLYKMTPDGKKYKGLIGIDNDDSFGNLTTDTQRQWGEMFSKIKFISEDMAAALSSLTKGKIEAALSDCKLEPEEIDAVMMRINALNKSVTENKIQIIKNSEWKDMTVEKLDDGWTSDPVHHVKVLSDQSKEELKTHVILGSKKLIHAKSNEIKAKTDYAAMATRLKTYCIGLEKVNVGLFVGSKQFDNMLKIANYVQKQYTLMSKEDVPEGMNKDEFNKKQHERSSSLLGLLRDITSMYIDHKNSDKSLDHSNTARDRVWAAMNLRHFTIDNTPPEDLPDRDFYLETAYQARINAYKSISPNELKTKIDNLIKISQNEEMGTAFKNQAEKDLSKFVNELKERTGLLKPIQEKEPQLI